LTVARLGTPQKRTDLLLEAFAIFSVENPEWKLRLVGSMEPDFERYFHDFLKKNSNLRNRIDYVGLIYDREQLACEYERAKIFTLCSDWESFGIVQVEAMSKGCALLCSDFKSAVNIIDDGNFGYYFRRGDINDYAVKMHKLARNEKLMEDISERIQVYAKDNFSWNNTIKPIIDFINEKGREEE
jgi:glycosyltransferase involved in cell wall biosynthesis